MPYFPYYIGTLQGTAPPDHWANVREGSVIFVHAPHLGLSGTHVLARVVGRTVRDGAALPILHLSVIQPYTVVPLMIGAAPMPLPVVRDRFDFVRVIVGLKKVDDQLDDQIKKLS